MLVDPALTLLPIRFPEPCLVGWHGHLGAQLDDTILTLNDLDLRARLVKVVAPADISRQDDLPTSPDTDE